MVRGIDKFKEYFFEFSDNYVIIGGTACDIHETQYAQVPRATKDFDIILIIEALSREFVTRFWNLIRDGNYGDRNRGENEISGRKNEFYRFKNPRDKAFPYQLELFSRRQGILDIPADAHLTPIPTDEDLSSLSAILMDDQYYNFTIEHSLNVEGVHIANIEALICLKARAYLEMKLRRENGAHEDLRHIEKHKKDVFRLSAILSAERPITLPPLLKTHIKEFISALKHELPDKNFFNAAGMRNITGELLLENLKDSFELD